MAITVPGALALVVDGLLCPAVAGVKGGRRPAQRTLDAGRGRTRRQHNAERPRLRRELLSALAGYAGPRPPAGLVPLARTARHKRIVPVTVDRGPGAFPLVRALSPGDIPGQVGQPIATLVGNFCLIYSLGPWESALAGFAIAGQNPPPLIGPSVRRCPRRQPGTRPDVAEVGRLRSSLSATASRPSGTPQLEPLTWSGRPGKPGTRGPRSERAST